MKFLNWIKRMFMSALNSIKGMVIDLISNAEAAVILTFSAIGITTILSELPFHYALPAFVDAAMVLPIISIFIVLTLITIMSWRTSCR